MKQLYVSDLDGTLLADDATLSDYSRDALNRLIKQNIPFTVATARNMRTIQRIFAGVNLRLPLITMNGACLSDGINGKHLHIEAIPTDLYCELRDRFYRNDRNFFISSYDGEADRMYYQDAKNEGYEWYIKDRINVSDPRLVQSEDFRESEAEQVICVAVIGSYDELALEFEDLHKHPGLEVYLQENRYSPPGWWWLTILSSKANKATAIQKLRELKSWQDMPLTVFGDHTNDLEMMKIADTAVATANGEQVVIDVADLTIGTNSSNAVVRYILEKEQMQVHE